MIGDPEQNKYDVFISYSDADQQWVRRKLIPRLKEVGLTYIDRFRLKLGHPRLQETERAIKESRWTLLILTKSYLEDTWSRFDSILVGSHDLEIGEWQAIPVIVEPCELPTRLNALIPMDLCAADESAWRHLLHTLSRRSENESGRSTATPSKQDSTRNLHPDHPSMTELLAQITDPFIKAIEEELRMNQTYWQEADLQTPVWSDSFTAVYFSHQADRIVELRETIDALQDDLGFVSHKSTHFVKRARAVLEQVLNQSAQIRQSIQIAPELSLGITTRQAALRVTQDAEQAKHSLSHVVLGTVKRSIGRRQLKIHLQTLAISLDELQKQMQRICDEAVHPSAFLN